jgi:hypothetical protein
MLLSCPITQETMADPVLCVGDGCTYEKEAIVQWFTSSNKSPSTGQTLNSQGKVLVPNQIVKQAIADITQEEYKHNYVGGAGAAAAGGGL